MLSTGLLGCATRLPPVEHVTVAAVPPALLTCQDAPVVPGATATQKDVASYVADLYGAWDDCHGNLATVDGLIQQQQKEVKP